ncbi:polysaccharide deacetylase family protein [Sunxiuqinia sp. A32]|uniref:polysaccharide deacetylase family protein n=1 Tax=Sunxiuqinia sp. A32 TaxID=3461496 RepID=UPI00404564FC
MTKIKENIISTLASPLPFRALKRGKRFPVFLPFYHTVSDNQNLPFRFNYEYPSINRFKADLDFLLKNFNPVGLEDLLFDKGLKNSFHLSFDDGLRSCYDIVAPILKEKGIQASFFVSPAFVDNNDLFHRYKASILIDFFQRKNLNIEVQKTYADIISLDEMAADVGIDWEDYLQKEKPYMTLEQIKSLQDDGFTIGAHSWDHPEFWLLDEIRQIDEIRDSMNWLNENLSPKIKAFAFPFSDWGVPDSVFETMQKEKLCDISFGTAGLKKETIRRHFQRVPMDAPANLNAQKRLKSEFLAYRLKKIFNRHITRR